MFTPFAFIKSPTSSISIVTDSLAFYINAINGNTTDTIGGQTGSISGSINTNSNQYWSGFSDGDCIIYDATGFNNPADNIVVTYEAWIYYSGSNPNTIESPLSIDRGGAYDDYIFFGYPNTSSVYTLIAETDPGPPKPDVEFYTTASILNSWCHCVTTIIGTGSDSVFTYIQPLNDIIYSASNATAFDYPVGYGPNMYVGTRPPLSDGFASGFINGYVGLVRIYDKVLTLEEIEQNYNAEKSRFEAY